MHNLSKCVSFLTAMMVALAIMLFPPVEQNEALATTPTVDLMEYAVDLGPPTMEETSTVTLNKELPEREDYFPDTVGIPMSLTGQMLQPEEEIQFLDRFISYHYIGKATNAPNISPVAEGRHWPLE